MNNITIYSIYSGIFYSVNEEEFSLLDDGQLPLVKQPSACKKCYSRGYVGFNVDKNMYTPCACVHKVTDLSRVHNKFNIKSSSV